MRNIFILMAAATILVTGCKCNNEKAAEAAAEEATEAANTEAVEQATETAIAFAEVENKPTFNGGDANQFSVWVSENLKYPQEAIDQKEEGKVVLQFVVSKDGNVEDVTVIQGVSELLDAEAVRVVSSSPKWEAGSQEGAPVAVKYTFPVVFQLQ